jgi:hypothetical protein
MEITCVSTLSGSTVTDRVNVSMRTKLKRKHQARKLQTETPAIPNALNCDVSLFGSQTTIPEYTYIIGVDSTVE